MLLGLVLGEKKKKESLYLEKKKSALIELRSMSNPVLRKMLYLCNMGWGVPQLHIRWA